MRYYRCDDSDAIWRQVQRMERELWALPETIEIPSDLS